MCFSKSLSLTFFIFGIFSSIMLMLYGNPNNYNTNLAIGYYFIYVSFMQLIEYFIWSDLQCKNGLNKLGCIIGPLLNHFQPVIIFMLSKIYLQSNNIINDNILYIINIIYIIYVLYIYFAIYMKQKLCTKLNKYKHIDWIWKYSFNYYIYWIILIINIYNYLDNEYIAITLFISTIFFIISYNNYHINIGEFWCLMVTSVPLIILLIQKISNYVHIPENNSLSK